jgi:hypothetical protein
MARLPWRQRSGRNRSQAGIQLQFETGGRLAPERDFGPVYPVYAGIAAGGATRENDWRSGQKAQFHEPPGFVVGKFQAVQDAGFALPEVGQGAGLAGLPATQLQHDFSIEPPCAGFKSEGGGSGFGGAGAFPSKQKFQTHRDPALPVTFSGRDGAGSRSRGSGIRGPIWTWLSVLNDAAGIAACTAVSPLSP